MNKNETEIKLRLNCPQKRNCNYSHLCQLRHPARSYVLSPKLSYVRLLPKRLKRLIKLRQRLQGTDTFSCITRLIEREQAELIKNFVEFEDLLKI